MQAVQNLFQLGRQLVVGAHHVAEHGVAADRRLLRAVKHGRGRWPVRIGVVGMPVAARLAGLGRLAVPGFVGDFKNLRVSVETVEGRGVVSIEVAEAA